MNVVAPVSDDSGLRVEDLRVRFQTREGEVEAVRGVSFDVRPGKTLCILGESGSGKSVTAQSIMGILDPAPRSRSEGKVFVNGTELLAMPVKQRQLMNGETIAMVFQDSLSALNPVFTVGEQIAELLRVKRRLGRKQAWEEAVALLNRVRIPAPRERALEYPHQFSGGMRQRVMIAVALALEPRILIADEPTTALDVTVQAQIMDLLGELQDEFGMAIVLITHDLGVVAEAADEVVVMYAGKIVERASVYEIFDNPAHPYTRALLASMPRTDRRDETLATIPGAPPNLLEPLVGCPFRTRCDVSLPVCASSDPRLQALTSREGRTAACHRSEEVFHGRI